MPVVARKLVRAGLYAAALLLVSVSRIVRPLIHVRFGTFESSRIGHYVLDVAQYVAGRSLGLRASGTVDLFWFPAITANEQWSKMARRKLKVHPFVKYLHVANELVPGGARHRIEPLPNSRDVGGWLQRPGEQLEFTPDEDAAAKAWMRERGWRDGEQFVCVLARDSAYLASHAVPAPPGGWSYHDYRDADIGTFVPAVEELASKGYWVIRLGKVGAKALNVSNLRVIDYPFLHEKNDLVEIWLAANCRFFISTGTGIDVVALVFRRPVVFVNYNPICNILSSAPGITVPKHLRWISTGSRLSLAEHLEHSYFSTDEYRRAGIGFDDLSATEIAAAVMEMEARLAGEWVETEEDLSRQGRFWEIVRGWPKYAQQHGYIHPDARPGAEWLRTEEDYLLSDKIWSTIERGTGFAAREPANDERA